MVAIYGIAYTGIAKSLIPSRPKTAEPVRFAADPENARTRVTHELELVKELVPLIKSGQKQATIRYGLNFIDARQIKIIPVQNRQPAGQPFHVEFQGLEIVPFGKITQHHVDLEGGGTVDELKDALRGFYGDIPDNYPMTVIRFKYEK